MKTRAKRALLKAEEKKETLDGVFEKDSWWERTGRSRLLDATSGLLMILAIVTMLLVWNIWQSKPRDVVVNLPTVTVTKTVSPTPTAKATK